MKVQARCIARAWDSDACIEYVPGGGPLPGGLYEIESDGKLASLTVVAVAYDSNGKPVQYFRDNDGKIQTRPTAKPPYVFDFDRNSTRTNEGIDVVKDYSCKKCGEKCKTLAELGRHANKEHKNDDLITDDEPVDMTRRTISPEVLAKRLVCKVCGERCPNLYALGQHKKSHVEETNAVAV